MTIREALKRHSKIEIELLLAHVLKKPKEFLYMNPDKSLSANQQISLSALIKRRMKGEPIAHILGYKDFYGLRFKVNKNVLIPRPETEMIIERLKDLKFKDFGKPVKILDLGTGSGCIVISLAKKLQPTSYKLQFYGSDISKKALSMAKLNAAKHKVKVKFIRSNLLKNIAFTPDILVANLPYGWKAWKNNTSAATTGLKFEPKEALFTKDYGLYEINRLLLQISQREAKPSLVYLEFDPRQKSKLHRLIKKHLPGADIKFHKDFAAKYRFAEISI